MIKSFSAGSPIISVFGGSRYGPNTQEYKDGMELGYLLACKGYTLLTGGYQGLMEAASQGASKAGGRVFAVAHAPWGVPNQYVQEYQTASTLFSRLQNLIEYADAFIALKGGLGTITEVAMVWVLLESKIISPTIPLILIGKEWAKVIDSWQSFLAVNETDCKLIYLVNSPPEAVEVLTTRLNR